MQTVSAIKIGTKTFTAERVKYVIENIIFNKNVHLIHNDDFLSEVIDELIAANLTELQNERYSVTEDLNSLLYSMYFETGEDGV